MSRFTSDVKHRLRNDVLFIGGLLLLLALLGLSLLLFRGEGDTVTVTVDGTLYGTYSLAEGTVVEIRTGTESESLNRLVIRDGKAFVEEANCPDGICAGHRPVNREGESIVCLPHRVVITVQTVKKNEPDIVA